MHPDTAKLQQPAVAWPAGVSKGPRHTGTAELQLEAHYLAHKTSVRASLSGVMQKKAEQGFASLLAADKANTAAGAVNQQCNGIALHGTWHPL